MKNLNSRETVLILRKIMVNSEREREKRWNKEKKKKKSLINQMAPLVIH